METTAQNQLCQTHQSQHRQPHQQQAADYDFPFEWPDHERLAKALRLIKGKFLLTINDHPDINKLYDGLPRIKIKMSYTPP